VSALARPIFSVAGVKFNMKRLASLSGLSLAVIAGTIAIPVTAAGAAERPRAFAQCATCHKTEKGVRSPSGPNLWGLSSRPVASAPGYTAYSPAMKKAGGTWTRERLTAFIMNPRKTVPGNRMVYAGQRDPKVAAQIADYVLSLK